MSTCDTVTFTIHGEPASKANSRKMVFNKKTGKVMFIKSKKALKYEKVFAQQCQALAEPFSGDVSVHMMIFYATRRPDLDESLILDCMQGLIYANDRQVKEKHIYHGIDRENPRAIITVECLD